MQRLILICFLALLVSPVKSQEITYAEKLGFPKGSKVLILHIDDVGMSWDSNQGAIQSIENGVATSLSIMMPCPWVPGFVHYMKEHPGVDAGLHLTLTSEWKDYRWPPLSGRPAVPGLVDTEGAMWRSVDLVAKNASPDEVETEIREQLKRARDIGFEPTHLDSHMGTLFATPQFLERYIKVGIENKIPVMFPGGHNTMIGKERDITPEIVTQLRQMGKMIWDAGLPVLDDLHNVSYNFEYPKGDLSDQELQKIATGQYIKTIRELKPGLAMVIMHCTSPSEIFSYIGSSGRIRKADMLAMMDPAFKKFLNDEKIILTTWREVKERRLNAK
ncbi:MAG: polysaccharide deacetylase family protein [Bacteroidota bacterium]|nr:polysaccharide deacetylase family protein [Bacteroidota bacterium]